jgi:hypothetical protein
LESGKFFAQVGWQNHDPALNLNQAIWTFAKLGFRRRLLSGFFPKRGSILIDHHDAVLTRSHGIKKV